MQYFDSVNMHYRSLWEMGVNVDFRDERECTDLSRYKLVICPMLFMLKEGFAQKLRAFVENGGTLLMTYFSGVVDESGNAWLGGAPHNLIDVLGVRATELDALFPEDKQAMLLADGRSFPIHELCEIPEMHGAKSLGLYEEDFYAAMPCLTRNSFGKGQAWYLAAKVEQAGLDAIYADIADELNLPRATREELPKGVIATERGGAIFLQNYSGKAQQITFEDKYTDLITGAAIQGEHIMPANGILVLVK
jgi:beta-galactosidase